MTTLDAPPLLGLIDGRGGTDAAPRRPLTHEEHKRFTKIVSRARFDGTITFSQADWVCVHVLRVLPELVWGSDWFADVIDDVEIVVTRSQPSATAPAVWLITCSCGHSEQVVGNNKVAIPAARSHARDQHRLVGRDFEDSLVREEVAA